MFPKWGTFVCIILGLRGNTIETFSLELSWKTNSEAEWMVLLQGVEIIASLNLQSIVNFGDKECYRKVLKMLGEKNLNLAHMEKRILNSINSIPKISSTIWQMFGNNYPLPPSYKMKARQWESAFPRRKGMAH